MSRLAEVEGFNLVQLPNGKYLSKFNTAMYLTDMSSGSKTLANIMCYPELPFSIRECGFNIMDIIYTLTDGRIYDTFIHLADTHNLFVGELEGEYTEPKTLWEIREWFNEVNGE